MILFAKTFQNFHYYTFSTVSLIEFKLTVADIEYKILYRDHNIHCDCFFISHKQCVSTVNIIRDIINDVYRQQQLLKITNDIKEKTTKRKSDIFDYQDMYSTFGGHKPLEYHYIVEYLPNGRNIVVKYENGKFEFVSYLEFEGEIYHHGNEKITEIDIYGKINYWTNMLNDITEIKKELEKI